MSHPDLGPSDLLPIDTTHLSLPTNGGTVSSADMREKEVDPIDTLLSGVAGYGSKFDEDDRDEIRHIFKVLKENAPRLAAREDLVRIVLEDVLANTGELVVGGAKGWSRIVLRLPTLQRVMSIESALRHTAQDLLLLP
jgi:hypothetical protein